MRYVAPGGPVSRALAVMAAADPDLQRISRLRRAIADRITADIELLDAIGGDPDLEDGADAEPSMCGVGTHLGGDAQFGLFASTYEGDDREGDDADGPEGDDERDVDVADEPHDPEEDKGAEEDEGPNRLVQFSGWNYHRLCDRSDITLDGGRQS